MIRATRSSGVLTANSRQAIRTGPDCRCRFRFTGDFVLRILLGLCYITGTCCDWKERMPRGTKELRLALRRQNELGYCDFDVACNWPWNTTRLDQDHSFDFKVATPGDIKYGPRTDASHTMDGHFLWFTGPGKMQLWSSTIPQTSSSCVLEIALYQIEMRDGAISLVINRNNTSSITTEKAGNNRERWEETWFNLRALSQPYKLLIEMSAPYPNSSIGVDNIRLSDCFTELTLVPIKCTENTFRCKNGQCVNRTQVCDLKKDCDDGEDEIPECDKIPEHARCNFEDGWCGWKNVPGKPLNWTLFRGPTPSDKTGPSFDHTYGNASGTYAYVNMYKRLGLGSSSTLESPIYNPTPPYHNDEKSPYYKTCQVRFFYHQYGTHSGSLALYLVQMKPHQNHSVQLWRIYGDKGNKWHNDAVTLPDIKYRYFLQFEANKGISSTGDVAIDDVSLSPECFGIGVPPEVVRDFDYYHPFIEWERIPDQHVDFINGTVIRLTTCGAKGRIGPTVEQCAKEYNSTDIELIVPPTSLRDPSFPLNGVQRWTAPHGGYYTLIGVGARGGKGSSGKGVTLGALVRGVLYLEKGAQLYFMVGQAGSDACPKNLDLTTDSCQTAGQMYGSYLGITSSVRDVKNIKIKDGGGGGGGATYIFQLKSNGIQHPILIAAGGGGLGLGQVSDNSLQHGRGPVPFGKQPLPSPILSPDDGAGRPGGGWNGSLNSNKGERPTAGAPLIHGGVGGIGCAPGNHSHGNGGFGGGGGGCLTGGGGGGYIGGHMGHEVSGNGEGGYSYASRELTHVHYQVEVNHKSGEVYIIPAISGCGCDFRCIALDPHLSLTECICPPGWLLSNDSIHCVVADDSKVTHQTFMILLITVSIVLLVAFTALCLLLYNRYQSRKALLRRRQVMFGNGTELTSLRAVTDTMMTEFNPNYEFAGNLYSFKDLPQIPRDYIHLVKPLGQGAFGEVFQGVYRYRRNEEHPVAVKTIPSSSTSQTEADFMMEALIMSKFNHPNIVHFIGVSFDKNPKYIVLELLAGGNLKNFLREERPRADRPTSLTMLDLIMCGYNVANGCKYMEEARFIHRDIAARNCLLTCKEPGRIVKIADFGMAKDIYRSDYYRKGGKAMLPIKWMPPESFLDGIFSTKTDVWAFGVLLWEIMSFGYIPYTGCTNRETMTMVTLGGRLEKPAGCPDPIYGIMTRCWHPRPEDRPSFTTIVERIGYCLQDPDVKNHPMPNFDILPIYHHEITIMRPDPEAECINVQSESKNKADSSNRDENSGHRTSTDIENSGKLETGDNGNNRPSETGSCRSSTLDVADVDRRNGNESITTTDTNSDSLIVPSSGTPPDTTNSSPNTRTCSPSHVGLNTTTTNVNGMLKKNALKAALSLDPSALCRGKIPYEKIMFPPSPQRSSTPGSMEIKKDPLAHQLPRAEECSC